MKSSRKGCRFLCGCWLLVGVYAVGVIAGIEMMSPSNMRFWGVRALIFKSLGWCVFVHCGIVVGFTVVRKWLQAVFALASVLLLMMSCFVVGLSIGPDVESVRLQTAEALGVSPTNLVCEGGCLVREAVLVFRVKERVVFSGVHDNVLPQSNVRQILDGRLRSLNIHPLEYSLADILRFPMEFNTVFALNASDGGWWVVFFRNAIM